MSDHAGKALQIIDLGRLGYDEAYALQQAHLEEVLASREAGAPEIGRILAVEHPPTITIGRHPGSARHLIASSESLLKHGIAVQESDRGGDITYHGPGQLVLYPIIDLNRVNLGIHAYMRLMEEAVIEACRDCGVTARREPGATGVWIDLEGQTAKVCAMGVRVRRWISMHGLAINIDPDLSHFDLIVPCGLAGRRVTSLREVLGERCPTFADVSERLMRFLASHLVAAANGADAARSSGASPKA